LSGSKACSAFFRHSVALWKLLTCSDNGAAPKRLLTTRGA
jgi:hypothetical protein